MTEPKLDARRRFDQCSTTCTTDCGHCKGDPVRALRAQLRKLEVERDAADEFRAHYRDVAAERGKIMFAAEAENAGLREALEAAREGLAAANPYWRIRSDRAEAERDAMRPVVEAAVAAAAGILEVTGATLDTPWLADHTRALLAAVDSYTQSSNPGEKP